MDLRRVTLVQVARKMRMFRVVQKERLQVFRDQEIRIDKAAKEWQADPTTDTRGEKSVNFESVKRLKAMQRSHNISTLDRQDN